MFTLSDDFSLLLAVYQCLGSCGCKFAPVPRFAYKAIDVDSVERVDQHFGIWLPTQHQTNGIRLHCVEALQELDAIHLRHLIIGAHRQNH